MLYILCISCGGAPQTPHQFWLAHQWVQWDGPVASSVPFFFALALEKLRKWGLLERELVGLMRPIVKEMMGSRGGGNDLMSYTYIYIYL